MSHEDFVELGEISDRVVIKDGNGNYSRPEKKAVHLAADIIDYGKLMGRFKIVSDRSEFDFWGHDPVDIEEGARILVYEKGGTIVDLGTGYFRCIVCTWEISSNSLREVERFLFEKHAKFEYGIEIPAVEKPAKTSEWTKEDIDVINVALDLIIDVDIDSLRAEDNSTVALELRHAIIARDKINGVTR